MDNLALRVGELVEVRSKEEILFTLDKLALLEGMPFMPQMFQYRGKQFRVVSRAHKTCDTVFPVRGRRLASAVHLDIRCDGEAYGGCQAGCLIFWKEAWLKRLDTRPGSKELLCAPSSIGSKEALCTEETVLAATRIPKLKVEGEAKTAYVCQATQLPYFTRDLGPFDLRQYIEDYTSGNAGLVRMFRGFVYMGFRRLINLGIGLGPPLRWFYDKFQQAWGGLPYPRHQGTIPAGQKTPTGTLGLRPGDSVRVKSYKEILSTLDENNKNRGLFFDAEMVPYCGGIFRVLKVVNQILDEKTGEMQEFKNPCIILDGVVCQSRYSECRLFCPRAIYSYWREIWLERVNEPSLDKAAGVSADKPRSSQPLSSH